MLSDNAITVLKRRYLQTNRGIQETPEEMFSRVANVVSSEENDRVEFSEVFYHLMATLNFLPNSPTLMNAGTMNQLSACFVLPVDDDMSSIFEAVKNTALIHQSGGGTGFSFSRLRPAGDMVNSTGGVASGPISFMHVFDAATDVIKQGGRRRGANMGILDITHPDILKFIECKRTEGWFPNFNISVAITEDFMQKVNSDLSYALINPRTGIGTEILSARTVFDKIAEMAWKNGEPGIIFIDRMNHFNPTPNLGKYEATNPCGEQVLLPNESCNLGSINLANMLVNGQIDWVLLEETTKLSVRFLDNVISVNRYPLPEIKEMTEKTRKIGLGVMGFADMLIAMEIPYDSEKAISVARSVMESINYWSKEASVELAKERGAFPSFDKSIYQIERMPIPRVHDSELDWQDLAKEIKLHGIRNATTTTIAPTGSISIIAGVSSGIEPLFALQYTRTVMDDDKLVEVHPQLQQIAEEKGFTLDQIPGDIKCVFVTAMDISAPWHIRMQAAFQAFTDNAVSKTINMPNEATVDDVRHAYVQAYTENCKGLTVYRDGSREKQVLVENAVENAEEVVATRSRPSVIHGVTQKIRTGCGGLFITINEDEQGLFEIFANMGKGGGCAASQAEATGRLISHALRSGVEVESIIELLKGIRCPKTAFDGGSVILSCSDAIAKALERYVNTGGEAQVMTDTKLTKSSEGARPDCPDCGAVLAFVEGCSTCIGCGFSECG